MRLGGLLIAVCGAGLLFVQSVVSGQTALPAKDPVTCSPIRINVPREIGRNYSIIFSVEKSREGSKIGFTVDSACDILSAKVIIDFRIANKPSLLLEAAIVDSKSESHALEATFDLPSEGFSEFAALQVVVVTDSGDTAAFVDTILIADRMQFSAPGPDIEENWWGQRIRRSIDSP